MFGFQGWGEDTLPSLQSALNISPFCSLENWLTITLNAGECLTLIHFKAFYFFPLNGYLMGINSNVSGVCPLIFFYPCKIYWFVCVYFVLMLLFYTILGFLFLTYHSF